jgi:hypothetical protein
VTFFVGAGFSREPTPGVVSAFDLSDQVDSPSTEARQAMCLARLRSLIRSAIARLISLLRSLVGELLTGGFEMHLPASVVLILVGAAAAAGRHRATWLATGNKIRPGGDMPRRGRRASPSPISTSSAPIGQIRGVRCIWVALVDTTADTDSRYEI